MKTRKILAAVFIILAIVLGVSFYMKIHFPEDLTGYFKKSYYSQYGPLAICIELLVAGIYLFVRHSKANFTLALFGFTALLDPIFDSVGLFSTMVPLYGTLIFVICALVALWLSFTDSFSLGKISFLAAFGSFILGNAVELFFNYW
ncbi:MAG: hypothetical protein AB3N14_06325 [Flavobacteriaceae bacterium]